MNPFQPQDQQGPVPPQVLEQALHWWVCLQSGQDDAGQAAACEAWRQADPQHELAWQRLAGLGSGLRDSTASLPAAQTRQLLQTRGNHSRRTLLKGLTGLGLLAASGWSVRERILLPELFSDYRTGTGQRRQLQLAPSIDLQLDTRTAVDIETDAVGRHLRLNSGRLLLSLGSLTPVQIHTADAWVVPAPLTRLMVSIGLPGRMATQVQVIAGHATLKRPGDNDLVLDGNQQVRIHATNNDPVHPLPASASAWTQGQLIAERMPLAEVLAELDRYRPGILRCADEVAMLRVSGAFSVDRPEASLELLARTLPIRIQRVMGYWATVVAA
ncbi:DUF4880 domain-containing protein [Pseudomonas sp. KCJK8993]|uniref:DUF4880 domain-containing protein n=1 Tax=Pseudomonas sp. KCJK8993 TaxID=3344565 RepID=UPI0039061EFC